MMAILDGFQKLSKEDFGGIKFSKLNNKKEAAEMMEEALNSGSLCLPDGVNIEDLRRSIHCSKAGIEPPKGLKISDKPMYIPLVMMKGADGK